MTMIVFSAAAAAAAALAAAFERRARVEALANEGCALCSIFFCCIIALGERRVCNA